MAEPRTRPKRLDPRRALVIDTRELNRRPGSMQKLTLRAEAPESLELATIGVPTGVALDLQLRLESVVEGVLVTGRVSGPVAGECARCLDPLTSQFEVDLQELYAYPESGVTEDEASRLEGDYLDLEPVLRDAVVLALPLTPLCRADCPGLCVVCGERRADVDCGHDQAPVDGRWAALSALAENDLTED